MSHPYPAPFIRSTLADADLCVKCGLCLPHCPTYLDSQHEGDSPRGRIALVQGLSTGLIAASARMEAQLDGCLSCRKCEVVCPARVPYSRVLDAGRAQLAALQPRRARLTRVLALLLIPETSRALLRGLLAVYRRSGVQWLVRRFGLLGRGSLARLESLLPTRPAKDRKPPDWFAVPAADADPIVLFRGCVTDVFERDALDATEVLLKAAGFEVRAANGQTCCGALHQHAGLPAEARRLAVTNLRAFAGHARIASCTSGCAATLRDYADCGLEGGADFAARVHEFADWLMPRADRLQFRPLPLRAALHVPCTLANVMKSDAALRDLLQCIPQLELIDLDPAQRCCGAAGSHFITHPAESDRLLEPKLEAIHRLKPDLVISSNIGCSLHLAGGITRSAAGSARPPVRHPAVVLAQQLEMRPPRS